MQQVDGRNVATNVLDKKLQHFRLIKTLYPHFYHKRGRENEPVYYEKPGRMQLSELRARGVDLDDLVESYAFMTEFLWQVVEKSDAKCRSISVIDVDGLGLFSFNAEAMEYLRQVSTYSKTHHPNRCGHIFIVNVPSWFDAVWQMIQTLVDPGVRKKITIVKADDVLEALSTRIPVENIPVEYGGKSEGPSDEELALCALADYNNGVPGSVDPCTTERYSRKVLVSQ
ncbi:unnamed protein product [Aphanomyces euteiches]|uniref:CRAL-TRIO domain-containing protein n=1 Tax=Aphanomyces euteiches TaxID=100861 RepID=A0A6G0XUD6_9STRA|nr:hypothetical protein Ae201684_000759 [Aphanomyces euteiches]KAH9099872.1 hypothetical protein Ae201684P_018880 [Aphanomyces euteiches]